MCKRATCPSCGKPTFVGCGRHVEQVLGDVPVDQRCQCEETKREQHPFASLVSRLFGARR
jgi:hypothetical protein